MARQNAFALLTLDKEMLNEVIKKEI